MTVVIRPLTVKMKIFDMKLQKQIFNCLLYVNLLEWDGNGETT